MNDGINGTNVGKLIDAVHLVTQRNQPYGSVRRCCEICGRMCWPGKEGSARVWTDDQATWEKHPNNCEKVSQR